MPTGHQPDCNCAICRKIRAKHVTVDPAVPNSPSEFFLGKQVVTTRQIRANRGASIPKGTVSIVHGHAHGKYKIEYRKIFCWVLPEDISPR